MERKLRVKTKFGEASIPDQYRCGRWLSSEIPRGEEGARMWLARDNEDIGSPLFMFKNKPLYDFPLYVWPAEWCDWKAEGNFWFNGFEISSVLFKEITLENSPIEAQIILED